MRIFIIIVLLFIFIQSSWAGDKINIKLHIIKGENNEWIDKDLQENIVSGIKESFKKNPDYCIVETLLDSQSLTKNQNLANCDLLLSVEIDRPKSGMKDYMFNREIMEYRTENARFGSSPKSIPTTYDKSKKYVSNIKIVLTRPDKIIYMSLIGADSIDDLNNLLDKKMSEFLSKIIYIKGHIISCSNNNVITDLCSKDSVSTGDILVIYPKNDNLLKETFNLPNSSKSIKGKIISVDNENSICEIASDVNSIANGDIVEYIKINNLKDESKNDFDLLPFGPFNFTIN